MTSSDPTFALLAAGREADRSAPRPTEWEVTDGRIRARWVAPERHHVTLRIMQIDGRWVAMPSGTLDRSTLILLTHATTWAGVVLEQMAAHEERANSSPFNDNEAREAAKAVARAFNKENNHAPSV